MNHRFFVGAVMLGISLGSTMSGARAFDETRYPNWKGQWLRSDTGIPRYDPSKPAGRGQEPPLTREYQTIWDASLADQAAGGPGRDPASVCIAPGMPRIMNNYQGAEFVVTPRTTHVLMENIYDFRRIFTDGRPWPEEIDPTFSGYSIGKWIDTGGKGPYDVLEVETRGLKGPRVFDSTGLPLASDDQTVIKERIFQDKADPNVLYDEMTTIDNALMRPWKAVKTYLRAQTQRPVWHESICVENSPYVEIAKQIYKLSADGFPDAGEKRPAAARLAVFQSNPKVNEGASHAIPVVFWRCLARDLSLLVFGRRPGLR